MFRTIKRILLSCISVLGVTFFIWMVFLLNPSLSYANETKVDFVTIHHNLDLDENAKQVVLDAIKIIKKSPLYHDEITIDLCLNDDKMYPSLHPLMKDEGPPLAFALFDKSTMKNCKVDFKNNLVSSEWAANNYEKRIFNLTYILAHEFTHNLQNDFDFGYILKSTKGYILNWKLEGYADYIAREFANDGLLKTRISKYLEEEKKEHIGYPVIKLEDGTCQIFWYFKCALVVQYLLEVKNLDFGQICKLETGFEELYGEMLEWANL